jgi:hypothetical protein
MLAEKNKNIYLFIFLAYWILLWLSINTEPSKHGLLSLSGNVFGSIRLIAGIFSTLLIITFSFFYILTKKKIKINKIYLILILIFISQIIGLYFNETKALSLYSSFLALLAIGTIALFILCEQIDIKSVIKYFFWILIFFLIIAFIISIYPKINNLQYLDFQRAFHKRDANIFGGSNPRVTGLSRSLSIINLFLILLFFNLKKVYSKSFMIILITIISVTIIFFQSRGTLLCYFTSLAVLIFFLQDTKKSFKLKNLLILVILPLILYFSFNTYINKNLLSNNKTEIKNRILAKTTSGRIEIWNYSLKNYNYKKIFGYGPQGDRFFLKDDTPRMKKYGDNSSNIFIYTLLSGGIISIILLILFFYEILKIFIKNKKLYLFNKGSIYLNFSILCIVFFSIRSLFENSFGLFSIDFLIMCLSVFFITNYTKKIITNDQS